MREAPARSIWRNKGLSFRVPQTWDQASYLDRQGQWTTWEKAAKFKSQEVYGIFGSPRGRWPGSGWLGHLVRIQRRKMLLFDGSGQDLAVLHAFKDGLGPPASHFPSLPSSHRQVVAGT